MPPEGGAYTSSPELISSDEDAPCRVVADS